MNSSEAIYMLIKYCFKLFKMCMDPLWVSLTPTFISIAGGQYQYILVDKKGEKKDVGFIQLNRPKALNALCDGLMMEVGKALDVFEADSEVGAIIITGSEKAFAGVKSSCEISCVL